MPIIISFLIAFLTTVLLTPFCRVMGLNWGITDHPDLRKVHTRVVPRTGGLALSIGFILPLYFFFSHKEDHLYFISAGAIMFLMGVLDDKFNLNFKIKLFGQIMAAILVAHFAGLKIESLGDFGDGGSFQVGALAVPLTVFFMLFVTNSINFVDGLDGLVGGLCLLIFSFMALLAYQMEGNNILLICAGIIGSLHGFLKYNTFPATIFLGDTGSLLLGFLASVCTMLLTQGNSIYSPSLTLFILGFPLMDALFVIIERYREGRSIFKPDKNHFHHKLLKMNFSHQAAVVVIYAIQALFIFLAFIFRFKSSVFLLSLYLLLTLSILITTFMVKRVNIKKRIPADYLNSYAEIKERINRDFFLKIPIVLMMVCILFFYLFSIFSQYQRNENILLVYMIIFIALITLVWFFKRSIIVKVDCFAAYFIGSYFIYLHASGKIISNYATFNIFSDYLFLGLGGLFMAANFIDLKKTDYDPVMYLIFFMALIAVAMYRDFTEYSFVAVMVVKIILLSMSIDLLTYKFKKKKGIITLITLLLLLCSGLRNVFY